MAKILTVLFVVILIAMLGVGAYFLINSFKSDTTLSIAGLYDKDKQPIDGNEQSVVGGVEGVKYIVLKVEVENKDSIPLDFKIIDASPTALKSALSLNSILSADVGQKATWTSGYIDVEPFEGTTQEFSVTIEGTSDLRDKSNKTSKISIKIDPDPQSSFNVIVTSEVNNDVGFEPPEEEIPEEETPTSSFETSASPSTEYASYKSGTYVKVDINGDNVLEQYNYASSITAGECVGDLLLTTSAGLKVNKYTGSTGLNINLCNPSGVGYKRYK